MSKSNEPTAKSLCPWLPALLRNKGDSPASASPSNRGNCGTQSKVFSSLCLSFLPYKMEELAVTTHQGCCRNSLRWFMRKDKINAWDTGSIIILWLLLFFLGLWKEGLGQPGGFSQGAQRWLEGWKPWFGEYLSFHTLRIWNLVWPRNLSCLLLRSFCPAHWPHSVVHKVHLSWTHPVFPNPLLSLWLLPFRLSWERPFCPAWEVGVPRSGVAEPASCPPGIHSSCLSWCSLGQ